MFVAAYVCVQGLNPAWRFASNRSSWWIVPIAHVDWLPSGIDGPFSRSNAWRELTVYASMWLLACSVWAGFLRRQSYRILFAVLVGNAFLLAVVGVLQQLIATNRIFWVYLPSNTSFVASFIYRNHAGAYFNLMTALGAGMALWHYERMRRRREAVGTVVILCFLAVFLGVMVLFSFSLTSIVLLLVFTSFAAGAMMLRLRSRRADDAGNASLFPAGIALVSFLVVGLLGLRTDVVSKRLAGVVQDPVASITDRAEVRKAALEMLGDKWVLGWGAGAFRYGFPIYAQKYPDIYYSGRGIIRYWEHAHDDLIEFPLELGLVGTMPIAVTLVYFTLQLLRRKFWHNDLSLFLALGCALAVLHGCVDFVFQNPAVLLTWGVLLVGALRWVELDQPMVRRPPPLSPA